MHIWQPREIGRPIHLMGEMETDGAYFKENLNWGRENFVLIFPRI